MSVWDTPDTMKTHNRGSNMNKASLTLIIPLVFSSFVNAKHHNKNNQLTQEQVESIIDESVAAQAKADSIQNWRNEQQRTYLVLNQSKTDYSQSSEISVNRTAINKNVEWNNQQDQDITQLQDDVGRLDGMVAASSALNSIVDNPNSDKIRLGIGFGHYRGQTALGAALQFGNEDAQFKTSVAGSSYDQFEDLTFGASINFGF